MALLPRGGADEARLSEVERDLAELERLIDDVLTTARLECDRLADASRRAGRARPAGRAGRARGLDPVVAARAVRVTDGRALTLVADETLLRRALWNLVENAAKYGAPPIILAGERIGNRVLVSVDDEGAGIAPARARGPGAVLSARCRADGRGRAGGFGLGLTFARRVAEVHGGTIEISAVRQWAVSSAVAG